MRYHYFIKLFFAGLFIFSACKSGAGKTQQLPDSAKTGQPATGVTEFDFKKPLHKWVVPEQLKEISGIVKLDSNRILAIEDLHPMIYLLTLDGDKATIVDTFSFYKTAKDKFDMEDLAVIGNTVYALWSHGSIFKIEDWQHTRKVTEMETGLSKENNTEGIAFDPATGNLLIACKNKSGIEDEKKSTRAVFEYDLKKAALKPEPFLLIEKNTIKEMNDGENIKFYPSGVAVNPISHDVYVISTRDVKCIAQFSHDGKLKSFASLDKEMLPQPEGLSFDTAGHLYISTEGKKDGQAFIYEFGN